MITRIRKIMSEEGINASQLAEKIGIQRSTLSHILSGRNKPSLDVITKILDVFPSVSADWLLRGVESGVYINKQENSPPDSKQVNTSEDPDLFSVMATTTEQISKPEEDKIEAPQQEEVVKQDVKAEIPVDKAIPQKNTSEAETVLDKDSEMKTKRSVEQVLIFYSDGTFKAYRPEK